MTIEQKEVFIAHYHAHFSAIYRYIGFRVYHRPDVEDIVSIVFLKAFEHYGSYEKKQNIPFSSWLFRIAHNEVVDYVRKKKRLILTLEEAEDIVSPAQAPGVGFDQKELLLKVQSSIEKLPRRQREIVTLRLFGERTTQEIALILGIKEKSVTSVYSRAIQKLFSFLNITSL